MKGTSAQDASLVDRLDELVRSGRSWLVSEINLLKGKAEFAARTYIIAVCTLLIAAIICGTALVLLALSAVAALTPHVGVPAAYALTGLGGLIIAAGLGGYAYLSITRLSLHSPTKLRKNQP